MNNRYRMVLILLVALTLVMPYAACQRVETPAPATPGPVVTPSPVAEPATPAAPALPAPAVPAKPSPSPAPPKPSPVPQRTPTAAPKAEPGVYRNASFGFVVRFPHAWLSEETGVRTPVVRINQMEAFPIVQVDINPSLDAPTLEKYVETYLGGIKQALTRFTIESEKDVTVGDQLAREAVFTWVSDNANLKGKMLFLLRGSQAFQVYAIAPRADFEANVKTIDEILYSFRLEEPSPFGIKRNEALTIFDVSPTTLDPAIAREANSHTYIVKVLGGLVALDEELNIVPDLAERWQVTEGGTVYTFQLRRNAVFHNGKPVTASDFKYSWERAANPGTKSLTVDTYLGDIVGVKDMLAGRSQDIRGIKVIDDNTLQVTIDAPKAYFLAKLTYPVAFVVDKDNVASGANWWRQANGTGPFKLVEWKRDELLILERNESYHREKSRVPFVVSRLFGGRPMTMYETGEIDVAGVGPADIDRARDPDNPLSKELKFFPVVSIDYVAFSIDRPPFDDARVRQAFVHAVDTQKILSRVLKDMNPKANGILPPGIPGHNPDLKGLEFNVEKAKQLIAESKYGSVASFPPIRFTLAGSGGDIPDQVAAIIQEWKENLGVQVTVRQLDPETFSYVIKEERDELTLGGWVADYPDPENFLDVLFHTGSQANDSGYSNPEIDSLLDKARVEQDPATRIRMYQDIETRLINDGAALPLWFGSHHVLVKPYLQGYRLSPLGYPMFELTTIGPR